MEKIIKTIKGGAVQVTVADERFYIDNDGAELASVTWISSFWPKGVDFYKWLATKGWDEAESVKNLAGDKGTKVHLAFAKIAMGEPVKITDRFPSKLSGQDEELSVDECDCLQSGLRFLNDVNPKVILSEQFIKNKEAGYAGTMDMLCEIDGELGILDIKTSQYIWKSHELQLSAYKKAYPGIRGTKLIGGQEIPAIVKPVTKLWILQLGYKRNKDRYKLTEVEDRYDLFEVAHNIWREEAGKQQPKRYEFPEVFEWKQESVATDAPAAIPDINTANAELGSGSVAEKKNKLKK